MAFDILEIANKDDSQSIEIPKKFMIDDDRVYIKKVGNVIHLIPYHSAWDSLINSTNLFSDDFMEERGDQPEQERESFD